MWCGRWPARERIHRLDGEIARRAGQPQKQPQHTAWKTPTMNKMNRPSLVISTAEVDAAAARPAPRVPAASPATVLAIVCVGICLANLDLFIVNVALPNIGRDFRDAPLEDMSWVLNGYAIAYAA